MPREILTAPSYEEFREPVLRFLRTWTQCGEILVLGAQRAAADEWVRAACQTALVGVHRMTLAQLAATLSAREIALAGATPVSRLAVEAVAALVTDQALRAGSLHYFEPVARMPGFAAALAGTLAELRLDRIAEADLAWAGGPAGDLAELARRYGDELRARSLVDTADQYAAAIRSEQHPLIGLPILLIDAVSEAVLQRDLLEALAARAPAMLEVRLGPGAPGPGTSLQSLQRYLFAPDVPPRAADDTVDLFAASGEALECIEVARRITQAAERGVPFDRMAILLRAPERYQPMVEEALRRARVPGYFTRGSRQPYASGRAFLALLECARQGLTAGKFAEYLSLGQMPESETVAAPVRWERLLVDAAVVGGLDRWQRRLHGLAEEYRLKHAAAEDEAGRESCTRQIELIESLGELALPIVERLAALPPAASWGDWLGTLGELAETTLRRPEAVLELLDELQPMAAIGPVELGDVLLVIEPRLRSLRRNEEAPRYGRVYVAAIEDARGMSFDTVFLPGLNEGTFPRPPSEDPLLLDSYRDRIPGARRRSHEDNDLLAMAAACAASRLVLSYSRLDLITGRQRVPSFYVFEALRAARGVGIDVRDIEREADRGAHTRIGWPAPPDPAQAIDDAEFDLAVLRPAFDEPLTGRGAGAYLTRVNSHLVRSLRARGRRWRAKWYAEDGLLELDIHALQILEQHQLAARPHSVSALQQFAVCPYRYALRAIHQLHPAEHPEQIQRMDPALRGEIFHRAQFEWYGEREGEDPLALMDRVLDLVAGRYRDKVAPAIPHVWAAEVEALRADLRGWLQQMSHADPSWQPAWFEFGFGLEQQDGHDAASVPEAVAVLEGALLRGSIDLVEQHAGGLLRITDHKTGSMPPKPPQFVGFGEVLQPVLYALVAEQALARPVATGRLYWATLRQNFRSVEIPINEYARQRMGQVLRTIGDAIHRGFLPAAPREDACRHCDYQPVCGPYEEERVGRKSTAELKPLRDLRRMA